MTLSPWIIYLWGISDSIDATLGAFSIVLWILAIISVTVFVGTHCDSDMADGKPLMNKLMPCMIALAILATLASVAMPDKRTIAIMVVAPAIINSEPIQKDLPEIYQLAKEALKQTLQNK